MIFCLYVCILPGQKENHQSVWRQATLMTVKNKQSTEFGQRVWRIKAVNAGRLLVQTPTVLSTLL